MSVVSMSVAKISSPSSASIRGRGVLVDPAVFFEDVRAKLGLDAHPQPANRAKQSRSGGVPATGRGNRQWRQQLTMAGFVAALIAAVVVGGEAASAGGSEPPDRSSAQLSVVVQPGDSLWSIARHLQPQGDVRPLVDHMVRANGSAAIVAGQTIIVPLP